VRPAADALTALVDLIADAVAERLTERLPTMGAVSAPLADPNELLDRNAAATHLGFKSRTLEAWANEGVGPRVTRVGKNVRYRRADLDAYVQANPRVAKRAIRREQRRQR
jgi:hypothetical protein